VRLTTRILPVLLIVPALCGTARAQEDSSAFAPVARLLQARCALPGCHAGSNPATGLHLESHEIYRATVNVHAVTDGRFLRVVPGAPDRSLLYLKLLPLAEGKYRGPRMPLAMDPLKPEEIAQVKSWIDTFPADLWGPLPQEEAEQFPVERSFQDVYLANLPTPEPIGRRTLEFRFSHRFKSAAADAGSDGLYGLDSGAWISLDLGYGVGRTVDVGLRRSNLDTDYEGYLKWAPVRQSPEGAPLSFALRLSLSDARDTGLTNRIKEGIQLILGRRFGRRLSLMLVPTYVSHTDSQVSDHSGGTVAMGGGLEWSLKPRLALTGEVVAQTSGIRAPYQSASIGISMGTARHVFHLILTNTRGLQTDQYVTGGDLDARNNQYRLGFNISRTHTFR
jgi:uncharacterized beta barrel domain-containing protein DUF5777